MSTPVLDIDALLAPIAGADPAGPNPIGVPERTQLDKARKDAVEEGRSLPVTDPLRVKMWRDVLKLAQDLLRGKAKSLNWAVRVVEAATRVHGFAGARDGFILLRRLTTEAWDHTWPKIDLSDAESEDDPVEKERREKELRVEGAEGRINQFAWLDDPEGGALFPNTLREVLIAEDAGVAINVIDCLPAAGKTAKVPQDQLASVARRLGYEKVQAARAEVAAAAEELAAFTLAVGDQYIAMGGEARGAPTFRQIREVLGECLRVADELTAAAGPPAGEAAATAEGAAAGGGGEAAGRITRESLYRQLSEIADHFTRIEPHSPVSFLIRRVVELQNLPFPELVRQLSKSDERVIGFLERSLKEGPAE